MRGRARAGVARGSCRALRVAHEAAGGAQEARARRGRVSCVRWHSEARRVAHAREHPTAMYVRLLALVVLALVGSFALGAASEPAGRVACRTRR